jgi:hypothetical protein
MVGHGEGVKSIGLDGVVDKGVLVSTEEGSGVDEDAIGSFVLMGFVGFAGTVEVQEDTKNAVSTTNSFVFIDKPPSISERKQ